MFVGLVRLFSGVVFVLLEVPRVFGTITACLLLASLDRHCGKKVILVLLLVVLLPPVLLVVLLVLLLGLLLVLLLDLVLLPCS